MSDHSSREPTLPAIHVLHLLQLVARWDVSPEELLAELDLGPESLALPGMRLPVSTVVALIESARALTGEPALGFHLGMQMQASWHGFLGFAAMSAPTVRAALELVSRFAPTRTSALTFRLDVRGDAAALVIEEGAPLGSARDAIVVALTVGFWKMGNALTGEQLGGSAEFAFVEPEYFKRFAHLGPGRVAFARPENRLLFETEILDKPIVMSDPGALELARQQCERELDALRAADDRIVHQVRASIRSESGPRTLEATARALGVSTRTLKRRLADRQTSFTELATAERRDRAMAMLRTDAAIEEIAERLGYADPQSFSRAFRRWTGMSPSAYRRGRAPGTP